MKFNSHHYLKIYFLISWVLLGISPAHAQDSGTFTSGLYLENIHEYGREVKFTDPVAFQLSDGTFQKPEEGQRISADLDAVWKTIQPAEDGKFKGRIRSGYLYLTYESEKKQNALIKVSGISMMYVNGVPRAGDIYGDGWLYLPITLEKGENEILARFNGLWSGIAAELLLDQKPALLKVADATLPDIVLGEDNGTLMGAVVVINNTSKPISNANMEAMLNEKVVTTPLPTIPPMTIRKVGFEINASEISQKGEYACSLNLLLGNKVVDNQTISLDAREATEHYKQTFVSEIDGSVQYYGVAPQTDGGSPGSALFLSVHGAGVEAIGQARAYQQKDWGTLVAPTNRRPRGFNWEDWGRIDAMEVLDLATEKFKPDPSRIYLTGHSMGGHGTWYLGATFAGKWAAIAPCAGYPTLMGYGSADGKIPENPESELEKTLLRASNPSNTIELAKNYASGGVYIHHGDNDRVVSVNYARQMRGILAKFHPDFSYYEYPGGSHWFGSESVDWPPLFDYFKWHERSPDSLTHTIDFSTANTAISSSNKWLHILQQEQSLSYSRANLQRDREELKISGITENIAVLGIDTQDFQVGDSISLHLDGEELVWVKDRTPTLYLYKSNGVWRPGQKPDLSAKGILRNGTFKEPFNHRMIFVYGTAGNKAENEWAYNKARFDAESWYYRGNGAVDLVSDREFELEKYADRGIIVYGNADTNRAWKTLLANSPVQVTREAVRLGDQILQQDNLGAYFMVPRKDNDTLGVAVVSGTGLKGLHTANANQYFAGGSGFPDFVVFTSELPVKGVEAIKAAGFYNNDWTLPAGK
ncbi:Alpha/beta hydrolase family protein [Cyclobacterium lianum]|uniref:Alpha/beta hydrolase family protein n=1 Tax=Cyclobacterium lianum TaxID=388280 RepID=A0A1M7KDB6_9BACT|nr:prolyl oligopeptidase family serine peptidase [Cyclobacterium lianum]SHM63229.1 Alpha/beta hydrolase family protein [Cyclobacterium lianum]